MINITEKQDCTLIESDNQTRCVPRGSESIAFTGGELVLFKKRPESPTGGTPVLKINRIQQVGTVTDQDGSAVSLTTVKQLAKDIAKFFV